MEPRKWQVGALVAFSSAGAARQVLVNTEEARAALICLREGQGLATHPAPGHAFVHVLSGRLAITWPPGEEEVGRGALFYLPPGTPHSLRALKDSVVLVTVAAPRRPG